MHSAAVALGISAAFDAVDNDVLCRPPYKRFGVNDIALVRFSRLSQVGYRTMYVPHPTRIRAKPLLFSLSVAPTCDVMKGQDICQRQSAGVAVE